MGPSDDEGRSSSLVVPPGAKRRENGEGILSLKDKIFLLLGGEEEEEEGKKGASRGQGRSRVMSVVCVRWAVSC